MGFLGDMAVKDFGEDANQKYGYQEAADAAQSEKQAAQQEYAKGAEVGKETAGVTDQAVKMQQDMAAGSYDAYQRLFGKVVSDAENYDSPDKMAMVRQEAAGNANSAFDVAEQSRRVELARMGVNPNSGRFSDPNSTSLVRAGGVAGAMNQATAGRQDTAIQLRQGVTQAAGAAALDAGRGAVATKITGLNAGLPWFNVGNSAMQGSAANLASLYGTAAKEFATASDYNMKTKENTANVANNIIGGIMKSSKTLKTGGEKVDDAKVLKRVMKIPVRRWKYKPGVADGAEHIGPYAEDVQRELGDKVAPGGKVIDVISLHGVNLAAIRAIGAKIERLERKVG